MLNSNEENMSFLLAIDNLLKFASESAISPNFFANLRILLASPKVDDLHLIENLKKELISFEKNINKTNPRFPIQSTIVLINTLQDIVDNPQSLQLMRAKILFIGYGQLQINKDREQAKSILDLLVEQNYLEALIFKINLLSSESHFSKYKYIDIEQEYCDYKYDKNYNILIDGNYLFEVKHFFQKGSVSAGIDLKNYFLRNQQKLIVDAYEPHLRKMIEERTPLVLRLLEKASKLGHKDSSHDLAEIYLNGCSPSFDVSVSQDVSKAISHLSLSIQQGQTEDVLNLVFLHIGESLIRRVDANIKLQNLMLITQSAFLLLKPFRNIKVAIGILEVFLKDFKKPTSILSLCAFELAEIYRCYEESGSYEYRKTRVCENYELSMRLGNHLAGIRLALLHLTGCWQLALPTNFVKCDKLLLEIVDNTHTVNKKANIAYQVANELDKLDHVETIFSRYLFWIFKSFNLGLHDKSIEHLVMQITDFTKDQKIKLDLINQWKNFSAKIEDYDNEDTGDVEPSESEEYLELKKLTYNFFNITLGNDSEMTIEEHSSLSLGM